MLITLFTGYDGSFLFWAGGECCRIYRLLYQLKFHCAGVLGLMDCILGPKKNPNEEIRLPNISVM